MSSVASGSSAVQSFRPLPAPRGPSAPADNAGENTTPFAMLLAANSSAADLPPASQADRPARPESQPNRRDNPQPTDDQHADSKPPAVQRNDGIQDARCGKADADRSKDSDVGDGATDTGDCKDGSDAVAAGPGTTDQNITDSTDACAQAAPAQIVVAPAIASVTFATDAAPAQPLTSPNDINVAPVATSLAAPMPDNPAPDGATPPAEQLAPGQSTTDNQSTGASEPAKTAKGNAPVAFTELANIAASATPAAPIEQSSALDPAEEAPPAQPTSDAAPATPAAAATTATPTEPTQKVAATGRIEQASPAETAAPVNEATPAAPTPQAVPATPALKPASIESAESTTAGTAANAQAAAKSQSDAGSAQVESANANAAIVAANGETAKNDGTKSEGELADKSSHRPAAEPPSGIETKADSPSRIADSTVIKIHADSAQSPTSSLPAPQALASTPTIAAPAITATATAAISLAGLPIEIAAQAKDGKNRFEIRLDPPELGRIDVRLDIDRSGNVTSRLTVERPETLDLLRRDAVQIERALQDAGLKTSDQGLQFSLRDQSFAGQNDDALPNAANLVLPQDDIVALEAIRQGYGRLIGLGGGIDIRV